MRPALFLDRDNTLIVADAYLGDPAKVVLMPGAAALVAGAKSLGMAVVTISNQSGVARGMYGKSDVLAVDRRTDDLLQADDPAAVIDLHESCPHHPDVGGPYGINCDCRKPKPGMFLRAAELLDLDLAASWAVGDAPRDVAAGAAAGCRTVLLDVPGLARSPAADAEATVEPGFRASSLNEVLEVIRREARG